MIDENLSNRTLLSEISDLAASIGVVIKQFQRLNNPLVDSQQKVPIATEQLDRVTTQTEAATHQMLDMAESILVREGDLIKELQKIKEFAVADLTDDIVSLTDRLVAKANTTLDDTYKMIGAMQFQDITAQRISQAAELLNEVEQKLTRIETAMSGSLVLGNAGSAEGDRSQQSSDPDAGLVDQEDAQAVVDDLISQQAARGK